MKKQKTQQGITLIALIITIVVLLILAVVTINELRDGGIITHAQNAVNDYTIAQEKEKISLAYSEYLMNKRTNANATLEVEGATVTGLEDSGWKVTFDKTNNAYEVDKNGNVEIAKEIVISEEKDIGAISYLYMTQYNPRQPEIISAKGYYNDTNKDGMVDDNPSQPARIKNTNFNIKTTLFEGVTLRGGDIEAKITHLDGSVEDITFKTTDNKVWEYEAESPLSGIDKLYIGFRAYSEYAYVSHASDIEQAKSSTQYHYMYIEGEVVVPFQKLELLERTLEFPAISVVDIGYNDETAQIYPMYEDINNVNKVIVNFSDGSQKVFLKEQIGTELFDENGRFVMELAVLGIQNPIISVIVEENGIITKYNVTDTTEVIHTRVGS